jgi:hypothetical protein
MFCIIIEHKSHHRLRCLGPPSRDARANANAVARKARSDAPVSATLALLTG